MKTVKKIWGKELWICNTKLYCGKILELSKGYQCSVHRHLKKDETFYILAGEVWLELGDATLHLRSGYAVRVKPRKWHRFTGLKNSKIIEFSTQHFDEDTERKTKSREIPKIELYLYGFSEKNHSN